jgi:4-hydroxy 2-oxovalerate aldolase
MVSIIDVTIRDGGFNNNWGFKVDEVKTMLKCASDTGIDIFEIGYLVNNNILKKEDGLWRNIDFNLVSSIIKEVKPKCRISALIDYWRYDINQLIPQKESMIDLIRVTCYMKKIQEAIDYCKKIKEKGYNVSINVMCASYMTDEILENIKLKVIENKDIFEFLYLADSYGSMTPNDVEKVFSSVLEVKKHNIKIGFHIHNNGQIGMANMISALKYVDIIDASYYGMGRGAGNVRLEDVILYLKIKENYNLNIKSFLNFLDKNSSKKYKDEIIDTIVGFLNIHPYRIRDYQNDNLDLYNLYLNLKNLSLDKKYDYLKN